MDQGPFLAPESGRGVWASPLFLPLPEKDSPFPDAALFPERAGSPVSLSPNRGDLGGGHTGSGLT